MPDMICDTGPIQRLHRAEALEVLKSLYGTIVIPQAVADEIAQGRKEGIVLPEVEKLDWIQVRPVRDPDMVSVSTGLGPGERAALALAMQTSGSVLIIDEVLARRQAKMLRQAVTGTVGVLIKAKRSGVIPRVAPVLDLLDSRGFRILPDSRAAILAWVNEH